MEQILYGKDKNEYIINIDNFEKKGIDCMDCGMETTASFSKTISESDVYGFAGIVGDFNGVHVNQIEAKNSRFGTRIVHGMLVGSFISTVLGTILPGQRTIYLEQNLQFIKPVFIGDTVTAYVELKDIIDEKKGRVKFETIVLNQENDIVVEGYAIVINDKYKSEH